jgi:hypothetical protein
MGPDSLARPAKRKRRKKKKSTRCRTATRPKKRKKTSVAQPAARRRTRKRCRRRTRRGPAPPGIAPPQPGDAEGSQPALPDPGSVGVAGPADEPPPQPAPPGSAIDSPIPTYGGAFGARQAERLLWRAGFGPRPGDGARLAALGLEEAVLSLTRPSGAATLTGPAPVDGDGNPLAPYDAYNHDILYWLDRMVRSDQQLVERMALVWHDWFATSNGVVQSNRFMLDQTDLFRLYAFGSFHELVVGVTPDRAMLLWLSGIDNRRNAVNENYARELMELFTLGADRGAYTETDVRELARALTGWRADYVDGVGFTNFRYDENRHDSGSKTVFGRTGTWTWQDACRLVVEHALHPSYLVGRLWSHFVPEPPSAPVAVALEARYVESGYQVRPLLEAILTSPELYTGPAMVKPPIVHIAGMLRALGRGIDTEAWDWVSSLAGQRLYYPPDVAGWDETRWLGTSSFLGRWEAVEVALEGHTVPPDTWGSYSATETPQEAVAAARAKWGDPALSAETAAVLESFAATCVPAGASRQQRAQRQNALRQLIAICPDYQTS